MWVQCVGSKYYFLSLESLSLLLYNQAVKFPYSRHEGICEQLR